MRIIHSTAAEWLLFFTLILILILMIAINIVKILIESWYYVHSNSSTSTI